MKRSHRSRSAGLKSASRKTGGSRIFVLILVLALLLGVGAGIIAILNPAEGAVGPGAASPTASDAGDLLGGKFPHGVYVDGIALGGLTREQVKQQVEAAQEQYAQTTAVTVARGDMSWQFTLAEADHSFDTGAVLDEAWKLGRKGTQEERQVAIEALQSNPVKLKTTVSVDPSALEQKVRELAEPFAREPVNAVFLGYDDTKPVGQRLSFTPDVPGELADADALWQAVKKEFIDKTFGTVQIQVTPVQAAITLADLQADLQLIGEFETEIRNSAKERRTNIRLASECINGRIIMPGETFSMNDATGERTAAKGYQKAPVDANGIEDVGLGGGVCQVSSTLYNAIMCLGPDRVEIVERHHHSIISSYMGLGYDATVDYGRKDIKFKNISDKPFLLIIYTVYDKSWKYDYHQRAEIYGVPNPDGAKYELYCKKVGTIDAKPGYRTVKSAELKPGETKIFKAHVGYYVNRYWRKTAKDGTVTDTLINKDTYPADCEVWAHNKGDAAPTPTPTPEPTPVITPEPPPAEPETPAA